MISGTELINNYRELEKRVRAAEEAAGRKNGCVTIVPAVKYATSEQINFLHREAGVCTIGENRVQTLLEHWEKLEDRENIKIHFIGSLQKNKVKYIIDKVSLIESVDSPELAAEIDRQAAKHGLVADVLVEINSGCEESKGGVLPDKAEELCCAIKDFEHLRLRGFMTMGPKYDNDRDRYANFYKTYMLALDIWKEKLHNIEIPLMSMGMTDSFTPAIAAGADFIRVGRAIFGMDARPLTDKNTQ